MALAVARFSHCPRGFVRGIRSLSAAARMQALFGVVVKVASLRWRLFGEKNDAVSPEARATLAILNAMTRTMTKGKSVQEMRETLEKYGAKVGPPSGTKIRELRCGAAGTLALWCETPGCDPVNGIVTVHFHGGGYVYGSARSVQGAILPVLAKVPCVGVLVDFRLCPEFTPNDALEDGLGVYRYLLQELKIDPARVVLFGESAGGALAIRVAQAAQRAGLPNPACIVSWSPWLDLARSYQGIVCDDVNTPDSMDKIRACIPEELRKPCSPLYDDPTGLPPLFLSGGGAELQTAEIREYADRCRAAGVELEFEMPPGLFHSFQINPVCPEAERSHRDTIAFMKRHTAARRADAAAAAVAAAAAADARTSSTGAGAAGVDVVAASPTPSVAESGGS